MTMSDATRGEHCHFCQSKAGFGALINAESYVEGKIRYRDRKKGMMGLT